MPTTTNHPGARVEQKIRREVQLNREGFGRPLIITFCRKLGCGDFFEELKKKVQSAVIVVIITAVCFEIVYIPIIVSLLF